MHFIDGILEPCDSCIDSGVLVIIVFMDIIQIINYIFYLLVLLDEPLLFSDAGCHMPEIVSFCEKLARPPSGSALRAMLADLVKFFIECVPHLADTPQVFRVRVVLVDFMYEIDFFFTIEHDGLDDVVKYGPILLLALSQPRDRQLVSDQLALSEEFDDISVRPEVIHQHRPLCVLGLEVFHDYLQEEIVLLLDRFEGEFAESLPANGEICKHLLDLLLLHDREILFLVSRGQGIREISLHKHISGGDLLNRERRPPGHLFVAGLRIDLVNQLIFIVMAG